MKGGRGCGLSFFFHPFLLSVMHTSPHLHISTSDGRGDFDYAELEAKEGLGRGGGNGNLQPKLHAGE